MLRPFTNPALEAAYQTERQEHLSTLDMRAAVAFVGLWLYDLMRFVGMTPLSGLLKATVWLAAVGMKPVYVYAIVGRDFYKQFRVWIISFTKVVFAMHPPGEHLHLASLANATVGAAVPAWRLLLTLANGMRLPYMILTGLGWGTFAFNIPLQLALVGRAIKDNEAQCSTAFFSSPQAQAVLHRLADGLTTVLSSALWMGAGIKGDQPAFPAGLDPCLLLGAWGALCSFLLTTLWLAVAERRARSEFARRHRHRLAADEQELAEQGSSPVWAWSGASLLFAYCCLLLWQVLLVVYSWAGRGGKLPFLMSGSPMESSTAFTEASLASEL